MRQLTKEHARFAQTRENCVVPGLILPGTDFVDLYRGMETARLVSSQLTDAGFKDLRMTSTNTEIYLTGRAV
jgi:hypothetical protein